eukprot:GHUV01040149.1.p1 GENE.GHUV01040149.1~~GHUV01040149.1.p1  ORF type:complete len:102 (+),score=13.78 GHUV01040149.1:423-728(+)
MALLIPDRIETVPLAHQGSKPLGMCKATSSLLEYVLQVRDRVDEVLVQVDLTERHGDLVGVAGSTGLPTEARKRLTIAVELVASPPVVFMDEPTSGGPSVL